LMMMGCWALAWLQITIATTAKVDSIVLRVICCTSGFLPDLLSNALISAYGATHQSG
jgi:hypothetical protein